MKIIILNLISLIIYNFLCKLFKILIKKNSLRKILLNELINSEEISNNNSVYNYWNYED